MQNNPFKIAEKVAKEANYQYEPVNDHIWRFLFTGRHMPEIDVVVVWQGQLFVIGSIVTLRPLMLDKLPQNSQLLEQLLLLNDRLDYVKVGLNREHMLSVRADLSVRTLDPLELRQVLDQVAAAADFIFGILQPYLEEAKNKHTHKTTALSSKPHH